jgi:hypothetical protein
MEILLILGEIDGGIFGRGKLCTDNFEIEVDAILLSNWLCLLRMHLPLKKLVLM